MAHHLAEQLHQAENAEGPDRQAAEDRTVALILKIWASRRDAPGNVDPLRRLENVLAVMDRMRPEAWPYRGYNNGIAQLLTQAFDGLRTLVWAGVLLTEWKDGPAFDPGSASEFLDDNERAVIQRLNEWIAFVDKLPARRHTVRIVSSEAEAAALDAEDKYEAEIDALPDPDRALKHLDQEFDCLIATLISLKTKMQTVHEQDDPDTSQDADEEQ